MGVRLSEMLEKTRETHIEWDDERVDFAYKPHAFTLELSDQIDAAADSGDQDVVSMLLSPLIVWWDVLDDDGARIKPDDENMKRFPMTFLLAIMAKINQETVPEAGA